MATRSCQGGWIIACGESEEFPGVGKENTRICIVIYRGPWCQWWALYGAYGGTIELMEIELSKSWRVGECESAPPSRNLNTIDGLARGHSSNY